MKSAIRKFCIGSLLLAWCFAGYQAIDGGLAPLGRYADKAMEWVITPAHPAEYGAPSQADWYATLRMPDSPSTSCCGAADAYWADTVEACEATDGPECWLVVRITDTRPDELLLDDGRKLSRPHLDVGTRIAVPRNKQRKMASFNPTDHGILFTREYGGEYNITNGGFTVFCYEPQTGL